MCTQVILGLHVMCGLMTNMLMVLHCMKGWHALNLADVLDSASVISMNAELSCFGCISGYQDPDIIRTCSS